MRCVCVIIHDTQMHFLINDSTLMCWPGRHHHQASQLCLPQSDRGGGVTHVLTNTYTENTGQVAMLG